MSYLRLAIRGVAFLLAFGTLTVAACWSYSIPLMVTTSAHAMVTGNAFYQYSALKSAPSSPALACLSVAKSSENFNTIMQVTLGIYAYISYRFGRLLHEPVFNKTRCTLLSPDKSDTLLNLILIGFVIVSVLDAIAAITQYCFIRALRSKYSRIEEEKSRRVANNSEKSAKPLSDNNESQKQADIANPINVAPGPVEKAAQSAAGDRDKADPVDIRTARLNSVKSRGKDGLLQPPSCPSTMSFNEKDLGANLKEVEKELMDMLKKNEEPQPDVVVSPDRPPKKPSKARKKKSDPPKPKAVDPLDKTQVDESEQIRTQKTQASHRVLSNTATPTATRNSSGGASSDTRVSV